MGISNKKIAHVMSCFYCWLKAMSELRHLAEQVKWFRGMDSDHD